MSYGHDAVVARLHETIDELVRENAELRKRVKEAIGMHIVGAAPRPFPPTEEMIETDCVERRHGR